MNKETLRELERIEAYGKLEAVALKDEAVALKGAIESKTYIASAEYLAQVARRKTFESLIRKANKNLKEQKEEILALIA